MHYVALIKSYHSSKFAYLKVLQIILLYIVQEIVNLDRTQHCAQCKHCSTIPHCTFTVKGSLCVHKNNGNLTGVKNNMELSYKQILQVHVNFYASSMDVQRCTNFLNFTVYTTVFSHDLVHLLQF